MLVRPFEGGIVLGRRGRIGIVPNNRTAASAVARVFDRALRSAPDVRGGSAPGARDVFGCVTGASRMQEKQTYENKHRERDARLNCFEKETATIACHASTHRIVAGAAGEAAIAHAMQTDRDSWDGPPFGCNRPPIWRL